jgi:hypothetical protein
MRIKQTLFRGSVGLFASALLSACVVHDTAISEYAPLSEEALLLSGEPDFNWHLSGDKRVAPRQVFSDQGRVWLQWHPHQAMPAVFVEHLNRWKLIETDQKGQYSVIDGPWRRLRFQGGQLQAYAVYMSGRGVSHTPCEAVVKPAGSRFELRLSDHTIRQALQRWATEVNWFFDDAHWTLPVDLPVTAPATFSGSFDAAVTELLASTRTAGESVKPCFYANHVLRVISAAQSCDPMDNRGDRP